MTLTDQLRQVQEALEIARLFPIRHPHNGASAVIKAIDHGRALLPAIIERVGELESVPDDLAARVEWALRNYATMRPAEMAQALREVWGRLR